ncbi:MAG: inorganic phosphate transporter [Bacteroidales bacterium]|jgi:PiT family inorganic phosphate transporter|nr:inorganic phosphate transporter [Bacteroidales bacterium]
MLTLVIIGIAIALVFDFLNGMNDAANSIATIVSTRVLSPFAAVAWAAFFNFAAYFLFGVHVANTIGKGIVNPAVVNEYFILSALIGAVVWVYVCTHFGLPISVSHALIGGMIGPALFVEGTEFIVASGVWKVVVFIFLSPLLGLILGYLMMVLTMFLFRNTPPRKVDHVFRFMQLLSSAFFSLGHGSNDAQKTMGIIAVLLFSTGYLGSEFYVPEWVVISAYSAISLGTLLGGWKVIKTMGMGLTDLRPVGGFCAETAGALTLMGTALAGIPVSTTHTITGSIIGVGVTRRASAVRWGTATHIVMAWVLTIPAAMLVSGLLYLVTHTFFL